MNVGGCVQLLDLAGDASFCLASTPFLTTHTSLTSNSMITLEVCVDSVDSAINALKGGADRLEICANLGAGGGTTPSLGLVSCIEGVCDEFDLKNVELMVMIRPRVGDFVYSQNEILVMKSDIREFAKCQRVNGVVLGALTPAGTVDTELTTDLASLAMDFRLQVCFHRAFDMVEDQERAFRDLSRIPNITRILTSGSAPQAPSALPSLKSLCTLKSSLAESVSSTRIMPGSGLNAETLPIILRDLLPLGVREVHLSGGRWYPSMMSFRREGMGMGSGGTQEWSVWKTDEDRVRAARNICDEIWREATVT